MSKPLRSSSLVLLLAVALLSSACVGTFRVSRHVLHWNRGLTEDKWGQEAAFVGLCIVPVYEISLLLDVLLYNSIEFWTGEHPLSEPGDG